MSNRNGHSKRGRKPVLREDQKRALTRLVRKVVRSELRRWVKGM